MLIEYFYVLGIVLSEEYLLYYLIFIIKFLWKYDLEEVEK